MAAEELGTALHTLAERLSPLYGEREAFLVAGMCLEKITGLPQHSLKRHASVVLTASQAEEHAAAQVADLENNAVRDQGRELNPAG